MADVRVEMSVSVCRPYIGTDAEKAHVHPPASP